MSVLEGEVLQFCLKILEGEVEQEALAVAVSSFNGTAFGKNFKYISSTVFLCQGQIKRLNKGRHSHCVAGGAVGKAHSILGGSGGHAPPGKFSASEAVEDHHN